MDSVLLGNELDMFVTIINWIWEKIYELRECLELRPIGKGEQVLEKR
jgi:hypothetical protein